VNVEELEVDRLYQSACYDITNFYVYRGGHGRKWFETKRIWHMRNVTVYKLKEA
jgi:hypothetical protein